MSFAPAADVAVVPATSAPPPHTHDCSSSKLGSAAIWTRWSGPGLPILVVATLLCLGVANIVARASFREAEDGVLWMQGPEGVVAAEIAEGTPAAAVGLSRGDVLLAIDDQPVQEVADVVSALHASQAGAAARYTVLRLGAREVVDVRTSRRFRTARGRSTSCWRRSASSRCWSAARCGCGGRATRRRCISSGCRWRSSALFTFSFSGRLDRLDWVFYWGDAVSILLLPPLFLHFTLVFPERSRRWTAGGTAGCSSR